MAGHAVQIVSTHVLRRAQRSVILGVEHLPSLLFSHCLDVPLTALKVLHGLLLTLTILPSHVDELVLIRKHIFFVKLVDLNELAVLKPAIEAAIKVAGPMPLK